MPVDVFEQTCRLNHGKSMAYITNFDLALYNQDKPTLLCVHGWLDNAQSFAPMLEFFNDYQVIIVDLMGHGKSDHRSLDAHYHLIDWVYDLKLFCQQLGLNQFYLIGHSLGGAISSVFAASEAHLVKALVLLESPGAFTQPEHELAKNIHLAFESRIKIAEKMGKGLVKRPLSLIESLVQIRVDKNQLEPGFAKALIERNLNIESDGFSWRSDPRLQTLSPIRLTPTQAKELLIAINCKVYVCLAENGFQVIRQTLERYFSQLKYGHLEYFAGSHHFHMPQAELVAKYIKEIIDNGT